MADELDRLSPEQINKLAKTINEAKDLTARQAEIIDMIIQGETNIGELRLSYLDRYFDKYSKSLDTLITRKRSSLSDAFLFAEQAIEKSSKTAKSKTNSGSEISSSTRAALTQSRNTISTEQVSQLLKAQNNLTKGQIAALERLQKDDISGKNFADRFGAFSNKNSEEQSNEIFSDAGAIKNRINIFAIEEARTKQEEALAQEHSEHIDAITKKRLALELARYAEAEENKQLLENRYTEKRLTAMEEALEAELNAQNLLNQLKIEAAYAKKVEADGTSEAGNIRAQMANAKEREKSLMAVESNVLKFKEREEAKSRAKNGGILTKEESARIQKLAAEKLTLDEKNLNKMTKRRSKVEAAKAYAEERKELRSELSTMRTAESFEERKEALYNLTHNEKGDFDIGKTISAAVLAVSDLAKQLEGQINEIASHKGVIDTRLQGSNNQKSSGSYWDQLVKDMTSVGAVNPFFRQADFASNIEKLVKQGISFDLKQRAFLMTVQGKIADTFEVTNATLLRLVRIQQEDSTAGRLGMESALNSFLNNMYETSEYLSTVATSVKASLEEMEALMQGAEAAEVEYQVQKWLGSLYSVGMSQESVTSISNALGQIASGQVEGLTSSGAGNLLIMAANDAGLSIADILTDGLDSSEMNKLLQATVNYLAELAESSKDNQVVQQQLANVFGVRASDLRAATNLTSSVNDVYGSMLTYEDMLGQLTSMAGSMWQRTSIAEMMTNIWENGKYTIAGSMASNPVSYIISNLATLLDNAVGGIDLPFINVMGFGVDLNTTVSDLMRVAAVGTGILGSLGPIMSGLGSSFSGASMLNKLGIGTGSGLAITPRGDGSNLLSAGGGSQSTSGSGYVGNASSSDVKDSTIQESKDSKEQLMIEAKEEAEENQVDVLNTYVIKIYELLDDVARGKSTFKVKVEDYGLTKAGSSGVGILSSSGSSVLGAGSSSTGGLNTGTSSKLSGWSTT